MKTLKVKAKDVDHWELTSACSRVGGIVDHTLKLGIRVDTESGSELVSELLDGSGVQLVFEDRFLQRAAAYPTDGEHVWKAMAGFNVALPLGWIVYELTLCALLCPEIKKPTKQKPLNRG